MGLRWFVALACLALGLTLGAAARADELGDLEKARNAYLAKQYEEADARFRTILDPKTGTLRAPGLIAEARMYWGATLLAMHRPEEARALFRKLLLDQRDYEPDPLRLPPETVNFFIDTRTQMREELKAADMEAARQEEQRRAEAAAAKARQEAWIAKLKEMASTEVVIQRHSRWLAFVPFGVGQFQNGDHAMGWFFLGTETVMLATTAATWPIYLAQRQKMSDAFRVNELNVADEWARRAQRTQIVNLAANGALLVTALVGVVHAQLRFVPYHTEVRRRPIPTASLLPVIVPAVGTERGELAGGLLGLQGTF